MRRATAARQRLISPPRAPPQSTAHGSARASSVHCSVITAPAAPDTSEMSASRRLLSVRVLLVVCACRAAWAACPPGWTAFGATCYLSVPGPADQPTAEQTCRDQHASAVLPSIHDLTTNSVLLALSGNLPFWTGLSNHTGGGQGAWSWQDGSAVDFYNWARGQPVLDNGRKACVWVYEGDGTWSNAQCNLLLGDVLCQL